MRLLTHGLLYEKDQRRMALIHTSASTVPQQTKQGWSEPHLGSCRRACIACHRCAREGNMQCSSATSAAGGSGTFTGDSL